MSTSYSEYKKHVSDIRKLINGRSDTDYAGDYGRFKVNEETDVKGIVDSKTAGVLLVFNKDKKLIRIQKGSSLFTPLSDIKDWVIVESETLDPYRKYAPVVNANIMIHQKAQEILEQIKAIKETKRVKIDLGDINRGRIYDIVANELYKSKAMGDYEAMRGAFQQGYTISRTATVTFKREGKGIVAKTKNVFANIVEDMPF